MSKFNKLALAAIISASTFIGSVSASTISPTTINDVTISFGGVTALDGSGLTSSNVAAADFQQGDNGFFVETFDQVGNIPFSDTATAFNDETGADGCGINSVNGFLPGISVDAVTGSDSLGVRRGTVSRVAAAPANDDTCFGYVSNANLAEDEPAEALFDYSGLLAASNDTGLTFLGFYFGSIDTFNEFEFLSEGEIVATITGSDILDVLSGQSGDQSADSSNVYVSFEFAQEDAFDQLVFRTTDVASEFDNIVIGLSSRVNPVPAPAGIALLAAGLLLVSARSRFKK